VKSKLLASGLGESQVGFSESNGAQEAQEKVCREGEMAIAGASVPTANRPRGIDTDMHPRGSPAIEGARALADTGNSARTETARGRKEGPLNSGGAPNGRL